MPIKKGLIDAVTWQMLAVSLQRDAYFPRQGVGTNAFGFLRLVLNEPEVAKAVEVVYRDTKWPQAELYSITVGTKKHRLVFGSDGKNHELVYPVQIDAALENAFLLRAVSLAQRNQAGFLLQQEGGWVLMFLYPPSGLFIAAFGWLLNGTVQSDSPAPSAGFVVCMLMVAMGVGVFLYPAIFSFWKRHVLRKALKEIGPAAIDQATASIRAVLRSMQSKA